MAGRIHRNPIGAMLQTLQLDKPRLLAFKYGELVLSEITLTPPEPSDVIVPQKVIEEVFTRIVERAQRLAQEDAADALDRMVEEEDIKVGGVTPVKAMLENQISGATLAAHVSCQVVADIDKPQQLKVAKTVATTLLVPLDDYASSLLEEVYGGGRVKRLSETQQSRESSLSRGRAVQAVRNVLREFAGRGA